MRVALRSRVPSVERGRMRRSLPLSFSLMKRAIALVAASFAMLGVAAAADAPKTKILTCKDANGRPVIADPSDPRCYKPPPTEDVKAANEERRRKLKEEYLACKAEQRANQSLVGRYPTKEKHDEARRTALAEIDATLKRSQDRFAQLVTERQRLLNEAEFYPKGSLPPKLRRDLDSNTALIEAQTEAIATQKADAAQKNAFYDDELARLKKLWVPQGDRRGCVAPAGLRRALSAARTASRRTAPRARRRCERACAVSASTSTPRCTAGRAAMRSNQPLRRGKSAQSMPWFCHERSHGKIAMSAIEYSSAAIQSRPRRRVSRTP